MQVAQFLCLKLTQKTDSSEQWRKQALESGVLHASWCGLQSNDQTIAEPCAGIFVPCRYSLTTKLEWELMCFSPHAAGHLDSIRQQQIALTLHICAHV